MRSSLINGVVGRMSVAPVYVVLPSGLRVDAFWKRMPKRADPAIVTGCPLAPASELAVSMLYRGIPGAPGAVLGPSSKTIRSNPGLCAIRIATSCAWLPAAPPVTRGHAAAGLEPGPGAAVVVGCAVAVAGGVAVGREVGVAAAVRGGVGRPEAAPRAAAGRPGSRRRAPAAWLRAKEGRSVRSRRQSVL